MNMAVDPQHLTTLENWGDKVLKKVEKGSSAVAIWLIQCIGQGLRIAWSAGVGMTGLIFYPVRLFLYPFFSSSRVAMKNWNDALLRRFYTIFEHLWTLLGLLLRPFTWALKGLGFLFAEGLKRIIAALASLIWSKARQNLPLQDSEEGD